MRQYSAQVLLIVAASIFLTIASVAQSPSGTAPYLNPQLPVSVRVDDLVSRMTLEEKASQLVNQARGFHGCKFLRMTGGARRCTGLLAPGQQLFFLNRSDSPPLLILR